VELPVAVTETLERAASGDGLLLFLTGAGISAESGVPTFRGAEGYWTVGSKNYHPQELATREAFSHMPDEVWRWYLYRRSVCRRAAPNAGHLALVRLEARFADRFALVTQNVDGLHLRAGSTRARTFEIHGNIDFLRWPAPEGPNIAPIPDSIGERGKDDPFTEGDRALLCGPGGEPARPHVLWFDEYYDEARFRAQTSMAAAARADLLVVVGTAGATNLPLQIAAVAVRRKIPILDVNPDADNPFAEASARVPGGASIRGAAAEVLPAIAKALGA
jgi:NAD-dependent deacetylase